MTQYNNSIPSVTTIIMGSSKQALEKWKQRQILLTALETTKLYQETDISYTDRVISIFQSQSSKNINIGNQIHQWIEQGFKKEGLKGKGLAYYSVAYKETCSHCGIKSWECEYPFKTRLYTGKVDLCNKDYIIDVKTKESLDYKKTMIYDDHIMQLAAYRNGLNYLGATCGILFISTTKIQSKLVLIEESKIKRGWAMFKSLLDYWYAKNGKNISSLL